MVSLTPTSAARRLAPGETVLVTFTGTASADPGLIARIEGGQGAFSVISLTAFDHIRVPYSEEELREIRPESLRRRLEREGKLEPVEAGTVGQDQPLDIPAGAKLEVVVKFAASGGKGSVASGTLVLEGLTRTTASLGMVVGSGLAECLVEPRELRAVMAPGFQIRRIVTIFDVPVAANALALIDAPFGGLSITSITVFRMDRVPFTDEELEQLPPHERENMKRQGHLVAAIVQTAGAGEALRVPEGGSVNIEIAINARRDATIIDGTLHVIANSWRPIAVWIRPRAQMLSVELSTNRIELEQGGDPVELIAVIKLAAGSPISVDARLGSPGDPWAFQTRLDAVPVSTGSGHSVRFHVSVPPDSPVGEHSTFLILEWNEGIGGVSVPLTIAIVPGFAAVHAFAPRFAGSQGGRARVGVRVDARAHKQVLFSAVYVPEGVVFLPPSKRWFEPGAHPLDLEFSIDLSCQSLPDQLVLVEWDAMDGRHRGRLELRLSVLVTPQERRFSRPIITPNGIPLGGEAQFILTNDGHGRFVGHMRATGFLSFSFQVVAVVRSAGGSIGVVGDAAGKVYGTDRPGNREFHWDKPLQTLFTADNWGQIATAEMSVSRAFEFAGILGKPLETLSKLVDILSGLAVLAPVPGGTALAVLIVGASEFGDLTGIPLLGPGGLPGLFTTAGASFLFGPGIVIPVFAVSTVVGQVAIRHRRMSSDEIDFAKRVFGDTLPFDRIILTNLSGVGNAAFVCPAGDDAILVNLGDDDAFDNPKTFKRRVSEKQARKGEQDEPGQLFIHELTHTWQIMHRAFDAEFLWRGTINKLFRKLTGKPTYDYGPPDIPFADFGLEGQASVVEEWFGGKRAHAPERTPLRDAMNANDSYFHYIADNIRLGKT